jgi:hypothetical protein
MASATLEVLSRAAAVLGGQAAVGAHYGIGHSLL